MGWRSHLPTAGGKPHAPTDVRTGADQPYDRLKRALRAEIDEAAWSNLYSTTSYPFDPPRTGKIAVKVINHYGDEVLKVFGVSPGAA